MYFPAFIILDKCAALYIFLFNHTPRDIGKRCSEIGSGSEDILRLE